MIGVLLIGITQSVLHAVVPSAAVPEMANPEAMGKYIAALPVWQLCLVLFAYGVGAFGGGLAGGLIADDQTILIGLIIGVGLTLFTLLNLLHIPHPFWFWIPGLLIHTPCAYLGAKCARK